MGLLALEVKAEYRLFVCLDVFLAHHFFISSACLCICVRIFRHQTVADVYALYILSCSTDADAVRLAAIHLVEFLSLD